MPIKPKDNQWKHIATFALETVKWNPSGFRVNGSIVITLEQWLVNLLSELAEDGFILL